MALRKNKWLFLLLSALFLVSGSALVSYGQFTVTLSAIGPWANAEPYSKSEPDRDPRSYRLIHRQRCRDRKFEFDRKGSFLPERRAFRDRHIVSIPVEPDLIRTRYVHVPGAPLFQIAGATSRVRFKDLALSSLTAGSNCTPILDEVQIENDGTSAIEMNTDVLRHTGDIKDVIFENVSIMNFTHGIKASTTNAFYERQISNIKIRGYRPISNHRQLYIDALYAHNWDVQNMNLTAMVIDQGGVEIVHAGRPSGFTGENGGLNSSSLAATETSNGQLTRLLLHSGAKTLRALLQPATLRGCRRRDPCGRYQRNPFRDHQYRSDSEGEQCRFRCL